MNAIEQCLKQLREAGRKAFIPFITAGDPHLPATGELIDELATRGADLIEIGFPYSDPLADGAVIQASYQRALSGGLRMESLFAAAREWTRHGIPLVAMASYSLVFRRGAENFLDQAKASGFAGLIVPDLPLEEAAEVAAAARQRELCLIQLVTPTTPPERATRIAALSSGFLYVVSVTGITGERSQLSDRLGDLLTLLRGVTSLPLCVGFGISTPEQAQRAAGNADGIIVGSALVKHLELASSQPWPQVRENIGQHAARLRTALNELTAATTGTAGAYA